MRIVAGIHKGRPLKRPPEAITRPTMDRTRESVFNILMHRWSLKNAVVLDGFAGSGAYGLESLSRGAKQVTFVDEARAATTIIRENCLALGEMNRSTILTLPITKLRPPEAPADLVFLDPPYHKNLISPALDHLVATQWIAQNTLVLVEIAENESFDLPSWTVHLERQYGQNRVCLASL